MKEIIKKNSNKILWASIFVYVLIFSFFCLKKYYNFDYNAFDLAIFNQVFYNTAEGRWFDMTINLNNYLADHFTPIIFLLLPIYKLWPRPENLLILQNIILSLSAWPLYKISEYVSRDKLIALGVAILWLINPFVHNANIYEFHLLPFAVFFIFWTFYFYQKNNFKLFILFFILTLFVREDMGLILIGFSFVSFLDKRTWKWRLVPLLGFVYLFISLKFIASIYQGENYKFLIYYNWLGGESLPEILMNWLRHPIKLFLHIFSFQNISTIVIVLMTFLFLPLMSPKYFYLAFFPVMQFALTSGYLNGSVVRRHYGLYFLPAIFIAIIFSLNILKNKKSFFFSKFVYNNKNFLKILFIFTVLYFSFFLSPLRYIFHSFKTQETITLKQEFLAEIPEQASVMADDAYTTMLSSREKIYPLLYSYLARTQFYVYPFEMPRVDYILIDNKDFFDVLNDVDSTEKFIEARGFKASELSMPENFRNILSKYNLIKTRNGILLWQNKDIDEQAKDILLYSLKDKKVDFDNDEFLVETSIEVKEDEYVLSLTFQKKFSEDNKYLVRFYKDNYYFDIPLDYGLWPEKTWPDNKLFTFYYYIDKDILSYQVFDWEGVNDFGLYKEIVVNKKMKPLTDLILLER